MNYIVFDLEWNQSSSKSSNNDCGMPFEIVEIGAVKLNKKMQIVDRFEQLIKPQIFHTMHYMTSKIIHLEREDLIQQGRPFPEVMQEFLNWCQKDYIFCIWGTLDITELQRNMCYYGMEELTTKPLPYLDVQKLFSLAFEDGSVRRSLEYAVDMLHIDKNEAFHRADADAYYTAKVLEKIHDEHPDVEDYLSFDIYMVPQSKKDEVKIRFKTYFKYISREFPDKITAMSDRTVSSTRCYLCGRNTKKIIKWFSANNRHYYYVGYCKKHGYMKGKVRMKKADDGNVFVIKTLKLITEEKVMAIKEKQEKLRASRAEKRHKDKEPT